MLALWDRNISGKLSIMKSSTLLLGLVALVSVALVWLSQRQLAGARVENESLKGQLNQVARLRGENERLSNLLSQVDNSPRSDSSANSELLRLRSEVTLLRRQLSQTTAQEQEKPALQPMALTSPPQVDEYESNALMAEILRQDPDALLHGTFTQFNGGSFYQGTNPNGRSIFTYRKGPTR